MVNPLVHSLASAVLTLCFAIMASTGGAMPACAEPDSAASHHDGTAGHPGEHHGAPAGIQGCVVHLCCAHLLVPAPARLSSDHLVALTPAAGRVPAADPPVTRTPHALPFAQAPPAPLV